LFLVLVAPYVQLVVSGDHKSPPLTFPTQFTTISSSTTIIDSRSYFCLSLCPPHVASYSGSSDLWSPASFYRVLVHHDSVFPVPSICAHVVCLLFLLMEWHLLCTFRAMSTVEFPFCFLSPPLFFSDFFIIFCVILLHRRFCVFSFLFFYCDGLLGFLLTRHQFLKFRSSHIVTFLCL